ncbi:SGNH/GDSL hydrolase family protein [Nocardioides sp. JQ2195]|uniref:SGNH/GDSL hydrolase family protein n=1 Tax=Nocardioides sp. JQ2195 TaxID=2592334 RepID=UPI00143E5AC6|nr:SGNH/GDSL hydrolase family protein [Nocardioides sp. JQ2195]QIX26169.1 SGNH/GDSL hydrolase family protein [Nocardioides sp. JQ2195]
MRAERLLLGAPVLALGAVGVLAWQGITARRTIERLPEADGLLGEHAGSGEALHLVVLGDSVAAGVGIAHHDETLAGRLAVLLSGDRAVRRTVVARSGLTAAGVLHLVESRAADLADADVVVLSVGVNDAKGMHSLRRWRRELDVLLASVTTSAPSARVVLLGVPDMGAFVRLPRPLRSVLGLRSRSLDRVGRALVATYPQVDHLALDPGMAGGAADLFADDGFRPSATLHAAIARDVHALVAGVPVPQIW